MDFEHLACTQNSAGHVLPPHCLAGVYYVRVFAENDNVNSERGSAEPFPANGRVVGELPT